MKFTYRLPAFLVVASLATGLSILGTCRYAHAAGPASPASATASGDSPTSQATNQTTETIIIPGPLRSFLRMAGISQESTSRRLLRCWPAMYFSMAIKWAGKTEYLILVDRYVHQARELQPLAGATAMIHIADCTDATPVIQVLGFRFEHGCSHE